MRIRIRMSMFMCTRLCICMCMYVMRGDRRHTLVCIRTCHTSAYLCLTCTPHMRIRIRIRMCMSICTRLCICMCMYVMHGDRCTCVCTRSARPHQSHKCVFVHLCLLYVHGQRAKCGVMSTYYSSHVCVCIYEACVWVYMYIHEYANVYLY
jgi:hypothetical protein